MESILHESRSWVWLMIGAVLYILLGMAALMSPVVSTVSLTFFLASLLVIGGAVRMIHAFYMRKEPGAVAHLFQAIIPLVVGILMFRYPTGGMIGIALALSFYFFLGAASQWLLFSMFPRYSGSVWIMISAILSFLMGVYILWTFPFSALWIPGVLLGVDLIFSGVALASYGMMVRNRDRRNPLSTSTMHPAH